MPPKLPHPSKFNYNKKEKNSKLIKRDFFKVPTLLNRDKKFYTIERNSAVKI